MEINIKKQETTVTVDKNELALVYQLSKDTTVTEAAQILNIKRRTAESRISRLKAKTGTKTIHALVLLFHKNDLLQ